MKRTFFPDRLLSILEGHSPYLWVTVGILLLFLIGLLDYMTGPEFSVSLFYLVPVSLVAWLVGGKTGVIFSIITTLVWVFADSMSGISYTHLAVIFWNSIMRFGVFAVMTILLSELRKALTSLQNAARYDFLTGAVNVRYFYELAQSEINRSRRYGHFITLVYIDLDNFKSVNDLLGHSTGDLVLQVVAKEIQRQIRTVDVIARLGGDEFALMLPETGETQAKDVIARIWIHLRDKMETQHWPITFSIGVVTFENTVVSVDQMVSMADERMYLIKTTSKNDVCYTTYPK